MDYALSPQKKQSLKHLDGDPTNHVHAEAIELKLPAEFIQVDVQQLEDETGMTSEEEGML